MPTRTYMEVDARHDHSLRIPRPDLSAKLGTPNACNACHADRTPAWSAAAVARWYGEDRRREPHWGETLAAARAHAPGAGVALAAFVGDASQPAIARATAVELLAGLGPEAQAALLGAIRDPEPLLRIAAARSLDLLPLEDRIEPAQLALKDPLRAVRVEAARALGPLASEFLGPDTRRALFAALEEYEALQRADADFATSHHNLAILAESGGDPKVAEAEYRAALRLDPGFQPARINLATLLSRTGQSAEAEALLREALARAPEDGEIHYSLALLLAEMGRLDEAERELREAAARLPGRPRIRYNHALALQQLGRIEEAEAELLALHEADPKATDVLRALVTLYAQTQQWERALPHARALVEILPEPGPRALLQRVDEEAAKRAADPRPGTG